MDIEFNLSLDFASKSHIWVLTPFKFANDCVSGIENDTKGYIVEASIGRSLGQHVSTSCLALVHKGKNRFTKVHCIEVMPQAVINFGEILFEMEPESWRLIIWSTHVKF